LILSHLLLILLQLLLVLCHGLCLRRLAGLLLLRIL